MEDKGITEAKFDEQLRVWAGRVRIGAFATLTSETHGTGRLANTLAHYVDKMRDQKGRHIAFRFEQYGVFRQYGAGRGYVVVNGVPVPGSRVVSLREMKNGTFRKNAGYIALRKRGFTDKQAKSAKNVGGEGKKPRVPLDWLDGKISDQAPKLADIAQEYFGDVAMRSVALEIENAKIVK